MITFWLKFKLSVLSKIHKKSTFFATILLDFDKIENNLIITKEEIRDEEGLEKICEYSAISGHPSYEQ